MAIGSSSAGEQKTEAWFQPVSASSTEPTSHLASTEDSDLPDAHHDGNPHRRLLLCTTIIALALFVLGMFVAQGSGTTSAKERGGLKSTTGLHPVNHGRSSSPRINFIGVGRFGDAANETATECLAVDKVSDGATGGHCAGVFRSHEGIYRNVTFLRNGVETVTYSTDARKVRELNAHVRMMTMMVRMGHKIHQHDPLFERMFSTKWKVKIVTERQALAHGVRVTQTSDDDCAVQLIHYHARAVSLFVDNGLDEFRCKHTLPTCAHSA